MMHSLTTSPSLTDNLSLYYKEISAIPLLSPEQETELARRWYDERDIQAAQQLVIANLRFVVKTALEYKKYGLRLLDLIQEGNIGLMQAVKRFNPYKGYRLITYAVWWIRVRIQDFLVRYWSIVKIGTTALQRKVLARLKSSGKRLKDKLTQANEDMQEDQRLAHEFHVPEREVTQFREFAQTKDVSIDVPLFEDSQIAVQDRLVDSSKNPEDNMAYREAQHVLQKRVRDAVAQLGERERFIVKRRLLSEKPMTLDEVGAHFHVSKERVRQVEIRVKNQLRNLLSDCGEVCFS